MTGDAATGPGVGEIAGRHQPLRTVLEEHGLDGLLVYVAEAGTEKVHAIRCGLVVA